MKVVVIVGVCLNCRREIILVDGYGDCPNKCGEKVKDRIVTGKRDYECELSPATVRRIQTGDSKA